MDSHNQFQRSRPSHPRPLSRSSTHTSNSRMTPVSANSSTSQVAASPQLSGHHGQHRYHHAPSAASTSSPRSASRLGPQLSRQVSSESTRQTAVSTFLQEKLQKERKLENDKFGYPPPLSRAATDMNMGTSLDFGRTMPGSPFRSAQSESSRPKSSAGAEQAKKKTMGVKEMEQVVSTLHKQNFDLKLELFHRREKQTTMEERLDALESQQTHMTETNDKLLAELESRDKAVEEAVAMIVSLEAKLEQFQKEREVTQAFNSQDVFCSDDLETTYAKSTSQASVPDAVKRDGGAGTLQRMPSFLSDKGDNTENLRKVYLGTRGSLLSLNPVEEGSQEMGNGGPLNGLASPTLSVLSESSFVSVYGHKKETGSAPQHVDEPLTLDALDEDINTRPQRESVATPMTNPAHSTNPTRAVRANSASRPQRQSSSNSITHIMNGESPLQKIERLDTKLSPRKDISRPASQGKGSEYRPESILNRSPAHKPTKQEKREALRRVLTDGPGGVRLHDQGYPPTPDTISTSTLRRFKNSNDTLSPQIEVPSEGNEGATLSTQSSGERLPEPPSGVFLGNPPAVEKPNWGNLDFRGNTFYSQQPTPMQRPRSAGETTLSHRQDDWDSDTEDSDTHSLQSSLDIWMRESAQPSRRGGRSSPDLFGFPTHASQGGWATNSMFGANSTQYGGANIRNHGDFMHDLFSTHQGVSRGDAPPPPPPHRRSSLYAQKGADADFFQSTGTPSVQESWANSSDARPRRTRRNSDDPQSRDDMRTPVPHQQPAPSEDQKKNHYPPIVGQQGPRAHLNRLFRRSISGSPWNKASSDSAPPSPAPMPETPDTFSQSPYYGVDPPSWVDRSCAIEDDRSGATPPPIMFNPRHGRRNTSVEIPAAMAVAMEQGRAASANFASGAKGLMAGPSQDMSGPKRKWLPGFGRPSNLRNRS